MPELILGIALAAVLLLLVAVRSWRKTTISRLELAFSDATTSWQNALEPQTRELYERFLQDPARIVRSTGAFEGLSKTEYDKARKIWSLWVARRQKAQELLQHSAQLHDQHRHLEWWHLSLSSLKNALKTLTEGRVEVDSSHLRDGAFAALAGLAEPITLATAALPQALLDGTRAAQGEYLRFENAIATANQIASSLRQEIGCDTDFHPESLAAKRKELYNIGLPFAPYQARLDVLSAASEQLFHTLLSNPLSEYGTSRRAVQDSVTTFKRDLDYACRKHGEIAREAGRPLKTTEAWIKSLRAAQVPSGLPGVEVFGTWRLDEEGYNPDPHIAEANRLLREFDEHLRAGHLTLLDQLQTNAIKSIDKAGKLVEEAMAEKELVEREMAAITASSLPADLQADAQTRQASVSDYIAQKWAQVRKNIDVLTALHEKRQSARLEAGSLLEQVAQVGRELKDNANIVSAELDQAYATLVRQSAALDAETKKGRADWDSLQATIVALRTHRVGNGEESVRASLSAEVAAYNEAAAQVLKLRNALQDLESKLSESWGGQEAVQLFAAIKPTITKVLDSSTQPKQDWHLLLRRAREACSSMEPAQALVDRDIACDREFHQMLVSFNSELESCRDMQYVRTICAEVFGRGVYCPVASPAALLEKAKAHYQQRHYEEMLEQLRLARTDLFRNHLDACWMCLQAISMSGDPCAQRFAAQQGYADNRYEQWRQEHLAQCENGALYNLPAVTLTAHKPGQFPRTIAGDTPSASDYLAGAAKP